MAYTYAYDGFLRDRSVVWVQGACSFLRGRNYSPVFSSYNECPVGASPFPPCGNLFVFALSIVHAVCCFFRVHPLLFSTPCVSLFVFSLSIVRAVCCFFGGCKPPSRLRGGLKSIMGVLRPPIMLSAQGFLFVKPNI